MGDTAYNHRRTIATVVNNQLQTPILLVNLQQNMKTGSLRSMSPMSDQVAQESEQGKKIKSSVVSLDDPTTLWSTQPRRSTKHGIGRAKICYRTKTTVIRTPLHQYEDFLKQKTDTNSRISLRCCNARILGFLGDLKRRTFAMHVQCAERESEHGRPLVGKLTL